MIAIVIPYFKAKYFEATLLSLSNQTDKRFKVYIGDDASPENPETTLSKYQDIIDFEYHVFSENLGSISLTKQWERCINFADEEWIMILGDDDVLSENVIKEFYKNLDNLDGLKVIRYASCKIDENGQVMSNVFEHPVKESSIDFLFRHRRNSLSEYIFKREQITNIGFKNFHLAWCSDILAVLEFSDFGLVYSINNATVFIRITSESISGNLENIKRKNLASEQFSYYIINQKLSFFNKLQCLKILYGYEVAIKRNRKLEMKDWLLLFKLYAKNFQLVPAIKFLRRFVIYLVN